MKKAILIIAFIIAGFMPAMSQVDVGVYYSIGIPTGDLGQFISKASFRGINVDFHSMVKSNIGVGFSTGWTVFYEAMDYDTYTYGNISISGKQYRYSNHIPLLASGVYYLSPDDDLNPFVKLGIGTVYTRRNTDMSEYTVEEEAWNFALVPEVGLQYKVGYDRSVSLSVRYNSAFQAGSELEGAQSFIAINLGFVF